MYLRDEDGTMGPAVIRPDAVYARDIAIGSAQPHENQALAQWCDEAKPGGNAGCGQLWALHVKGHSTSSWNHTKSHCGHYVFRVDNSDTVDTAVSRA